MPTVIEIDENYQIITEYRGFLACKESGLKEVPCVIIKNLTEEQKLERQLIENIHREPLTDIEKAKAIKKLLDITGWNQFTAAVNLGISNTTICRLLALVEAPKEICW